MENYYGNKNPININSTEVININEIPEQNELQKMYEYINKIKEYQKNNYVNCLLKNSFCDCLINGEWIVGLIIEKDESGITVVNINQYYEYNQS